ncbi:amidohydrolase/deacetylase family metallohydrolase [Pullulanibacillus sp. KACC 23026]|nr:amidohydrolase/deacetylase family metallohydrolase [Pullulanibacillus sp. KACC 23026]WEG14970.1 amidohydrolase/deacetylase family metallohydrolase [Pullulanibacillus sp. KACC 23026]
MWDLKIKGGTLMDIATGRQGQYDLYIDNGIIVRVEKSGSPIYKTKEELDATGCVVTPGLIDLHVHVFQGTVGMGVAPDSVGIQQGVTTVVDAGSSGARYFQEFKTKEVETSKTQVLAWINIAGSGLCESLSELADLNDIDLDLTKKVIKKNEIIRGIKARMSASVVKESGIEPLTIAKSLGNQLDIPLMVHIGNAPPPLPDILDRLTKGDVVTHAFHGKKGGIIDNHGDLIPSAKKALERGVLFDVGHGTSSFSFKTMKKALALNVAPYTISTDIYEKNIKGPVHSLVTTMSKFLALGCSLENIIRWTTVNPAKILRLEELGTLAEGTVADISILKLTEDPIKLIDSEGEAITSDKQIIAKYAVKSGKVFSVNGKSYE